MRDGGRGAHADGHMGECWCCDDDDDDDSGGGCICMQILAVTSTTPLSHNHTHPSHPPQGILAAPLIMGNDLRLMSPGSKAILQNRMAVQINQDPLGTAGTRISEFGDQEVWARALQVCATPVG